MATPELDPVLVVTGPPGAGKTTAARLLAASRQRAVHLESDRFFHFVASGYVEPWRPEAHEQNTVVMGIVGRAAAAYADAGYFTIVDGIVSPRWFYVPLRDALRTAGHRVAYAVLRAPLDVCVARAAGRDERGLADRAVVEQLWRDFADLGPLERHAVDTGATSAEAAAELLARRLGDELLVA